MPPLVQLDPNVKQDPSPRYIAPLNVPARGDEKVKVIGGKCILSYASLIIAMVNTLPKLRG